MVIGKVLSGATAATVSLANVTHRGTVQVWQLTSANTIARLADIPISGTSFSVTLPPQSITLFVIPSSGALPSAPTGLRFVGSTSPP
jgi:O-glycosyl hydrolase